jgi:cardiolipin synthase
MHRLKKILTSRLILFVILVIFQVWLLFMLLWKAAVTYQFYQYLVYFSYILVIYIANKKEDSSYKIAWSVLILILPLLGGMLYLFCGGRKMPKKLSNGTTQATQQMKHLLVQDPGTMERLKNIRPGVHKMFRYALETSNLPAYGNTEVTYYKSGEDFFEPFLAELKKAKHFILMEYFIIDEGVMWNAILEILKQKAAEGVEVKLIYDDFGCATTLPDHYDRKLNRMGIETYRFNHMRPALIVQMNNRDHRKICVIDNQVGFTGGLNLADEYINHIRRFGYWKDSACMLKGEAVWSLTVMFLGMYSYLRESRDPIDYEKYHLPTDIRTDRGLVQPFSDTPTDAEDVGLSMHLNMVNHAKQYVYIDTPYLIVNGDMQRALILAAKNGVDVRILTPHIPDKWYVFEITQANYLPLIEAGVKIYQYTPGFVHTKNFVSDDCVAIVGTVNTDYRSYYLHFECGALMYDVPAVMDIKKDFVDALAMSHEVTAEECRRVNVFRRVFRALLNLASPLL